MITSIPSRKYGFTYFGGFGGGFCGSVVVVLTGGFDGFTGFLGFVMGGIG
jgi:hypothetical protein